MFQMNMLQMQQERENDRKEDRHKMMTMVMSSFPHLTHDDSDDFQEKE